MGTRKKPSHNPQRPLGSLMGALNRKPTRGIQGRLAVACFVGVLMLANHLWPQLHLASPAMAQEGNAWGWLEELLGIRNTPPSKAEFVTGTVTKIADGDTVTLIDEHGKRHKIRLLGIDAPEAQQAHGQASRLWLEAQVNNQPIKALLKDVDQYGRSVGKLILPGEPCGQAVCPGDVDINLKAVSEGMAWWYRKYAKNQYDGDTRLYEQAEAHARAGKRGLWKNSDAQPPWEWRKANRNQ